MKTLQFTIIGTIFTLLNFNVLCQKAFPNFDDNAQWNVEECFWGKCETETYSFEYDTIFCGNIYSKLNVIDKGMSGYFRSDNLKTYFRKTNKCSDKEYLIYDYSLHIGDTTFVAFNNEINDIQKDTTEFILTGIDTFMLSGIQRTRLKLLFDPYNKKDFSKEMYWIKGIGSLSHPFYTFKCFQSGCEKSYKLLCYDSLSTQLYKDQSSINCKSTYATLNKLENKISILPNPFQEVITLKLEDYLIYKISIYSSIGVKLIELTDINSQNIIVNTSKLNPGSYLIEINTNKGFISENITKLN